jgi:antitoxin VapB
MANRAKTRVFNTGRSQAVVIPEAFCFTTDNVSIRRDPRTGDIILSQTQGDWADIFAALDEAGFPENFLADRKQ